MNKTIKLEILPAVTFLYAVWLFPFSSEQMLQLLKTDSGWDTNYAAKVRLETCDSVAYTEAKGSLYLNNSIMQIE